jgi:predicted ATPase/DNA-binding SARP family transcriptional activator
VEFRVLGTLTVVVGDRPVRISGAGERIVLSALLTSPGVVVAADRLMDLLWGDDPPGNARNALHAVVVRLRRALGAGRDLIVTRPPGYLLAVDPDRVDAWRFARLVAEGQQRLPLDPAGADGVLREALGLWRGSPFQDIASDPSAQPEIVRLQELRLAAIETKADALLRLGRHYELAAELQALVAEHPLRERMCGQLMTALYRSGRQADALDVYRRTMAALSDDLGIDPGPDLQLLYQAILRQELEFAPPGHGPESRLPARISTFIGRRIELARLAHLVKANRLITVIGPGGSGKTSLAVEVARSMGAPDDKTGWTGGTVFVDLAAVSEPAHVPAAVAAAIGVGRGSGGAAGTPSSPLQLIEAYCRARPPLLLLDNCEHLIGAAARFAEHILRAAPQVTVLATSREPLGLPGEVCWAIPGLALPKAGDSGWDFDAVRLFANRATAARPRFELDEINGPAVVEICRRLDGMPLAIELAAARVRAMPVVEIARRLDHRFALLVGPGNAGPARQHTLRATIDWSHQLLTDAERLIFAKLAVFAGPWSVDAAEAVCADQDLPAPDVMELLTRLADRSLIEPEPETGRFHMLETVREYARERLDLIDPQQLVRTRHAAHFLALAEAAGEQPESAVLWQALEDAAPEINAALDWSLVNGRTDLALRFTGALGWYWATWHDREGIDRVRAVLGAVPAAETAEYGRALRARVYVESYAPTGQTRRAAARAVELLDQAGDRRGAGRARLIRAFVELMAGEDAIAAGLIDTAQKSCAVNSDSWGSALASLSQFRLHLHTGTIGPAIEAGHRALRQFQALGDPWGFPWTTLWLAIATRTAGDVATASRLFHDAISAATRLPYVTCSAHAELGGLAALRGDYDQARRHTETALRLAPTTGVRDSLPAAHNAAGFAARLWGDLHYAEASHRHALELFGELNSDTGVAHTLCCLGLTEHHLGQPNAAYEHLLDALKLAGQGGRLDILTAAVEGLASIIARRHPRPAAELLAAARSVRESTEIRLTLIEGHDTTNAWRAVRAALPSTVEAEATRGTRLQLRDLEHFARAVAAATHDA